jgi:hypothetical protein
VSHVKEGSDADDSSLRTRPRFIDDVILNELSEYECNGDCCFQVTGAGDDIENGCS